jgi:hypothetical protein
MEALGVGYGASIKVGDEPLVSISKTDWPGLRDYLHTWARGVRVWMDTPDLWEEFRQAAEALESAEGADSSNALFTPAEQDQISARIQQVKDYVRTTYELTAKQFAQVEERLDTVEEASLRIGRKDWLMMFNGAIFSLVLSDLIPQQAATHIVVMAITGLGHLFGIGSMPPSLPPG